jgi:hypothetical protein
MNRLQAKITLWRGNGKGPKTSGSRKNHRIRMRRLLQARRRLDSRVHFALRRAENIGHTGKVSCAGFDKMIACRH